MGIKPKTPTDRDRLLNFDLENEIIQEPSIDTISNEGQEDSLV